MMDKKIILAVFAIFLVGSIVFLGMRMGEIGGAKEWVEIVIDDDPIDCQNVAECRTELINMGLPEDLVNGAVLKCTEGHCYEEVEPWTRE